MTKNNFAQGIKDGLPICLGYLSVSFAFGIFGANHGFSVLEAVLISMLNVTSAGQLAGVPIIAAGGSFLELAISQIVINLRYSLMSVSLSQKLGKSIKNADRLIISFVNTDEVFAVSSSKDGLLHKSYMYGLILTPWLGWSFGTFLGASAGNVLPKSIISALGIAIYAMFLAIVIPETKKSKNTAFCVLFAILLSTIFYYTPYLKNISTGFSIIICSVLASAIFAHFAPIEDVEVSEDE